SARLFAVSAGCFPHFVLGTRCPNHGPASSEPSCARRIGHRPDERAKPSKDRPTKKHVEKDDRRRVVVVTPVRDERRQEVEKGAREDYHRCANRRVTHVSSPSMLRPPGG